MRIAHLPDLKTVGSHHDEMHLACLISAAHDGYFRYFTVVQGAFCSCRIFAERPFADAVGLPRFLSPVEVARELLRLGDQTRRPSADFIQFEGWNEGWKIQS